MKDKQERAERDWAAIHAHAGLTDLAPEDMELAVGAFEDRTGRLWLVDGQGISWTLTDEAAIGFYLHDGGAQRWIALRDGKRVVDVVFPPAPHSN